MTILAWHNDAALKANAVKRMRAHRRADDFIQKNYLEIEHNTQRHRGCFHGCLTAEVLAGERGWDLVEDMASHCQISWWKETERLFGFPRVLCELLDDVFELMDTQREAGQWAVDITESIPVGADLTQVMDAVHDAAVEGDAQRIVELLRTAPVPESGAS